VILAETRTKQRGIGLLELMLSLAIIAVLIVIVARYFESVRFSQQAAATHAEMMEIIQAAERYRAINGDYYGADLDKVAPWLSAKTASKVTGTGGTAYIPAPFGGGIKLELWWAWTDPRNYILLRIVVPAGGSDTLEKCEKIAAAIAGATCDGTNIVNLQYPTIRDVKKTPDGSR
jgi:type II secretory pathway pseudopilin PulG